MRQPLVLVVAENPFLLGLVSDLLDANDIAVACARGAEDAVALASRFDPPVVIVDADLPSRLFIDLVLTLGRGGAVQVIVAADDAGAARWTPAVARLIDARVPKPIEMGTFARVVLGRLRLDRSSARVEPKTPTSAEATHTG